MNQRKIRTYSELILFPTYEERFEYLKIGGFVGNTTFGFDRYLNQDFYRSREWKRLRNEIFVRDNGCDLAFEERPIIGRYIIHHMNPILAEDIIHSSEFLLNPEYLITVDPETHNAIHYGKEREGPPSFVERKPNDMSPWKN